MKYKTHSSIYSRKKKNYLKFSLLLAFLTLFMFGCAADQAPISFQSNYKLLDQYKRVASDKNVKIYYNVKKSAGGTFIDFAVKNISGAFASNFTINLTQCCAQEISKKVAHRYIDLGTIKMSSIRKSSFRIPEKDLDSVTVNYQFDASNENFFAQKKDIHTSQNYQEKTEGNIVLNLK